MPFPPKRIKITKPSNTLSTSFIFLISSPFPYSNSRSSLSSLPDQHIFHTLLDLHSPWVREHLIPVYHQIALTTLFSTVSIDQNFTKAYSPTKTWYEYHVHLHILCIDRTRNKYLHIFEDYRTKWKVLKRQRVSPMFVIFDVFRMEWTAKLCVRKMGSLRIRGITN